MSDIDQKRWPFELHHPLIICEWLDSAEPEINAEIIAQDFPEPQIIYQIGLLVFEADSYITMAGACKPMAAGDQDSYDYVISIPKVAIVSIHTL